MKVEADLEKYSMVSLMIDGVHLRARTELVQGVDGAFGLEDYGDIQTASNK